MTSSSIQKKIQWAAFYNDTLLLDKYNLSEELFKRFQRNEIKVSLPIYDDYLVHDYIENNKIRYTTKKKLEESLPTSFVEPMYDTSGNVLFDTSPQKPLSRIDNFSYNKINIEQILYVVNGKLYSYIPWVSPKLSVYTSRNIFLGTTNYFTTCFNFQYNFKSSKRDKVIFITSTKRKFLLDSFPRSDRLKELYGVSMLEAIWKDLINNKNEIINVNSGQKTTAENLHKYFFAHYVDIPLYDSLGNVMASQPYNEPISPSLFQQIEITQNWFYDYTKNVVTNNISDVTLFLRSKSYLDNNKLIPVIKIIFK